MKSRKFWQSDGVFSVLLTLVGMILLVALGFSFNSLFASRGKQSTRTSKNPQSPSSIQRLFSDSTPDTSHSNPMTGWETYKDKEYGFSVRYPKTWTVQMGNDRSPYLPSKTVSFRSKKAFEFTIVPLEDAPDLSVEELARYLNEKMLGTYPEEGEKGVSVISLDGQRAIRLVLVTQSIQDTYVAFISTVLTVDTQAFWFFTQYQADPETGKPSASEGKERLEMYDRLLQTFHLLP